MQDVLAAVSSSCRGRTGERGKTCGAYFPDLPPEKPSALLPRERLKIHQGWAGGKAFPPSRHGDQTGPPQLLLVLVTRYKTNGYLVWGASSPKDRDSESSSVGMPDDG